MSQNPFLPVPLNPRHDGWTPERQWAFVEALADTASITRAAEIVGMSVRSAQKLRRHPLAGEFRAAWDAALGQAWGGLEQVALDRAINGEVETIERDGMVVAARRRPCSDRLLIHLLNARHKAAAAARARREADHGRAVAEAEARARVAYALAPARRRPPPPELPAPVGDAEAEATALVAFRAHARAFVDWPAIAADAADARLADPGPEVRLEPAGGRLPATLRRARLRPPEARTDPDSAPPAPADAPESPAAEGDHAPLRWQDYARGDAAPRPTRPPRPEVRLRVW